MNLITILGLLFLTLKLTGHIDWSWWWVLAPFWIPLTIAAAGWVMIGISYLLMTKEERVRQRAVWALEKLADKLDERNK